MEEAQITKFETGAVVFGRFRIEESLGAGSVGHVYRATLVEDSSHQVAIKVLLPQAARDATVVERFKNEIHALYRVSHTNVVRGFEFFRFGEGMAFTMEYVEGCKLSDITPPGHPLPLDEVLIIIRQLCLGLREIHAAGIVHRDLKPENILITPNGVVKITDFSVARIEARASLTCHGGMIGTMDYLSPEYLGEGDLDIRADIYALGIIAYQMVTGVLPFAGQNLVEMVSVKLNYDLKPPHCINQNCPQELSFIIEKACTREVEKRYQSVTEMLNDLILSGLIPDDPVEASTLSSSHVQQPPRMNSAKSATSTRGKKPLVTDTFAAAVGGGPSDHFIERRRPQSPLRRFVNVLFAISAILMVMLCQSLYEIASTHGSRVSAIERAPADVTHDSDASIRVIVGRE